MPAPRTTEPSSPDQTDPSLDPRFGSVKQMARILGLSVAQCYVLLDQHQVESRYFGKRRLVDIASVHRFADSLPTQRTG